MEVDQVVSRSTDWVSECSGIEDITCFLDLRIELCGVMLDVVILRYRVGADNLPVLWREL